MKFLDQCKIYAKAGDGGAGCLGVIEHLLGDAPELVL